LSKRSDIGIVPVFYFLAFIEDNKVVKKILDHLGIYEFDNKRAPPKVAEDPDGFDDYIISGYIDSDHVC